MNLKKIWKFFAKLSVAFLLALGIYKSYEFYKENKRQRMEVRALHLESSEKPFVIVISAYNNNTYCEKSLLSAVTQNYQNFRVVYVDDASNDGSFEKIQAMIAGSNWKNKISCIRNEHHKGIASLYDTIQTLENQEIVVAVDGNDFLAHEHVLEKLNKVYAKPYVWMTYGNFLDYPSYRQIPVKCKQIPKNIVFNNSFRSHEIWEPHLKTFYASLFKEIRKEDLLFKGRYLSAENGIAYFLPLLELAGKHAYFINEVLYLHTRSQTSLSADCLAHIKKLPKYKRLKTLFPSEKTANEP